MSINFGDSKIKKISFGNEKISKVYFGFDLIWKRGVGEEKVKIFFFDDAPYYEKGKHIIYIYDTIWERPEMARHKKDGDKLVAIEYIKKRYSLTYNARDNSYKADRPIMTIGSEIHDLNYEELTFIFDVS